MEKSFDIKQTKEYQELEKENQQLEKQIHILQEKVKIAERASTKKSSFLAQTSHEIRTPLNIIIGLLQLAKDEVADQEKMKDYLMKIEGSSKVLLGIINDILDMSAIEGGKMKIDHKTFDFKEQLTNLSIMYFQQAKKKDIRFDVHLKGVSEETLIGDELRLNQILINLLGNAMKFTPAGGNIDLTVVQASTSRDRAHMRFMVRDTGCGISEEMQKRLFKPFEQESATTARKYGGSGLGLSITKNLVDLMGGTIQVKSALGEGTEFIVDLPFDRVKQTAKAKINSIFATYHALIVADSEENCRERGAVLEDMGLSYDIATDAEDALDMIGEAEDSDNPYKLCIIDWRVSSMSGVKLVKEIRDIFGDEIVIIGAAYDLSEALSHGKEAGADYMVAKPVFRSTLFDALMKISQGKIDQYDDENIAETYHFDGKRILLAEDVALNMEVAVKLLKKVSVSVICAENGKEAVDIYNAKPDHYFDGVLLDINMPVMDGYEAAKLIRKSSKPDAKTIPIYAMTANAFTEDVAEALNAGMDGHIAKPIETDVLYKTLNHIFNGEEENQNLDLTKEA